jgi:hypothetical protein
MAIVANLFARAVYGIEEVDVAHEQALKSTR